MRLTDLPTDVLLSIAEEVEHESELNSLIQAVRCLYDCLNDSLYRRNIREHECRGLISAVRKGRESTVQNFLQLGASVNTTERKYYGTTSILSIAAEEGHAHIVELLLAADGIAPDIQGEKASPLFYAVDGDHLTVVRLLLQDSRIDPNRGSSRSHTPLYQAALCGNDHVVRLLLDDPRIAPEIPTRSGVTALNPAAVRSHSAVVKTLLEDGRIDPNLPGTGEMMTPLYGALECGADANTISILLAAERVDPELRNGNGQTALSLAADRSHTAGVRLLLERGVHVNVVDEDGVTPLLSATRCGRSEVVALLLGAGADPNVSDVFGWTPLELAAVQKWRKVLQMLLQHPSTDPNLAGSECLDVLIFALESGYTSAVKLLFSHGWIDINDKISIHGTALCIATVYRRTETVDFLLTYESIDVNSKGQGGKTPLIYAMSRHPSLVLRLLKHKDVDVNARDEEGRTALHWAVSPPEEISVHSCFEENDMSTIIREIIESSLERPWNNQEALEMLLRRRDLDRNPKNKRRLTPLASAIVWGNQTAVKTLLADGNVDLNTRDCNGRTLSQIASLKADSVILELPAQKRCMTTDLETPPS